MCFFGALEYGVSALESSGVVNWPVTHCSPFTQGAHNADEITASEAYGSSSLLQAALTTLVALVWAFIIWIYWAFNISPIIDCYCMGAVPDL